MINEFLHKLLVLSEKDKTIEWATELVSIIRRDATPLISKPVYDKLRNVLYGTFPEADLEKLFKGREMQRAKQKLSKSTVYFFERVRNSLIDDRTSAGLSITVNSLDPEKEDKKRKDRDLLENRAAIQSILGEITNNNGMPPITVDTKNDFHGNIDEFDKAGYEDFDNDDKNAFFDNKYALLSEVYIQNALNAILRTNQVTRLYPEWIDDILICLYACSRVYVDLLDGHFVTEYQKPYEVKVFGRTLSNDYKDSQAILTEKTTNVRTFIRMVGDNFDFSKNWEDLLHAITYTSGEQDRYTGIIDDSFGTVLYGETGNCLSMRNFLDAAITYGYIEWKAFNASVRQTTTIYGVPVNLPVNEQYPRQDGMPDATKISEETYKSYYIATGYTSQRLINFGKLYLQPTEGANDQYSGFSFKIFKRNGISAAEIIKPFWEIMQRSFQKVEMLVNDVKPDGNLYVYESLVKVAEFLQGAKDTPTDIRNTLDAVMEMYNESPNKITSIPTDDEGNIIGGGAFAVQKERNGLNDAAIQLMKIMDWCEEKVDRQLATQGIGIAEPRDGYKLSIENKVRARAATAYIDYILLNHLEDVCITLINYVQDAAKFKDIPAYKYLEFLVGKEALDYLNTLKKSPHRNAVFLDTFNNDVSLMELRQRAAISLERKEINFGQYTIIMSMDNPKQIMFYMTHELLRQQKLYQRNQLDMLKQQDQLSEAEHRRRLELEDRKGQWMRLARKEEAQGYIGAAQLNSQASLTRAQIQQEGQNKRIVQEGENKLSEIGEKYKNEQQKSLV